MSGEDGLVFVVSVGDDFGASILGDRIRSYKCSKSRVEQDRKERDLKATHVASVDHVRNAGLY